MKQLKTFLLMGMTVVAVRAQAEDLAAGQANALPYIDQDFACITQQQAQKYTNDFSIDINSFGGLELCNSNVDAKKLFNDLQIIEQGQFAAVNSNILVKGYIPADQYYSWMKNQTRGMNRGNDIPYATAYNRMGYFTMQDGWAKISTLGRVGVVLHEARHTGGYRHYPCKQGPYMGSSLDGCDQDFTQGGSHAIEMEYYARVTVAGQNFHPVYKAMARLMAMGRASFVFNTSPIQKREAVLALEEQAGPVMFDGTRKVQREGTDSVGQLKRTSFGAVIFNGLQAVALDVYEMTGFRSKTNDDYSYFKLLGMNQMGSLRDFEEYDVNQKRYVTAVTASNQLATYNFPKGSWNSPATLPLTVERTASTLPTGEKGYFLMNNVGDIYSVNADNQQVTSTGKKWDAQVQSAALFGGKILLLKNDGAIYQKNADGTEALFDNGKYTQMVNVPLYDAFEVK